MEQQVIQKGSKQQQKANVTGIPTQMKLDFEQRGGFLEKNKNVQYYDMKSILEPKHSKLSTTAVIQMYTKSEVDNLLRRFAQRGWYFSEEYCMGLLEAVDRGENPRIGNHFAVLQRTRNNVLRIISRRFSGNGMMGRVGGSDGANYTVEDLTGITDHEQEIPNYFMASVRLDRSSLKDVTPRKPLDAVMGASAYELSDIVASEFLHMIAHQLGGQDVPDNLIAGTHALNTAMIPIENMVHNFLESNICVDYNVQFFPRPGPIIWVDAVQIGLEIELQNGIRRGYRVRIALEENGDVSRLISQESFDMVLEFVQRVKDDVMHL